MSSSGRGRPWGVVGWVTSRRARMFCDVIGGVAGEGHNKQTSGGPIVFAMGMSV